MKIALSAPSGYNSREILLPLRSVLDADQSISNIAVITPAADHHTVLFPQFSDSYSWHANPDGLDEHKQLLTSIGPDVVITPTIGLDPKDIPILRAANELGIPTLTFVASWDNVFKMERLRAKGHSGDTKRHAGDYELPTYWAVWNQMNYDHVLKAFPEVTPEQITITGPPRFDYFAHADRIPSREALFEYIGLTDPASKLIHGATTELYPFEYILETIASARDSKKLRDDIGLYASVHPGGDITKHVYSKYRAVVRYSFGRRDEALHPDFAYVPTDEETYMLIALFSHTDVLVNQSSTVAIESFRVDKPVINVAYGQPWDWWRWRRSMVYRDFQQHYRYITDEGATSIVHSKRELVEGINRYLENPQLEREERAKTITKMISFTDGGNGKRLLDVTKAIVGE